MAIGLNVTTWVWAQGGTHSTSAGGDQVTDEGTLGTHGGTHMRTLTATHTRPL